MKLPLKWLKDYVDYNVTHKEFASKMLLRGFEVADIIPEMKVSNVVVCTITHIEQHPNAERLRVCNIDIGAENELVIVTNAANVYEGCQVPVALDGAILADGTEIKPTKMRGVLSSGMFCGGAELGINDVEYEGAGADSVLILNDGTKYTNGMRIQEALELDDVIFDIELTPNRPDCQSIIGLCREAASALGQKFHEPVIKPVAGSGSAADYAKVTVLNPNLCPRSCARVVTDLKIEPSPKWMQLRLKLSGIRPINNIVDITNYVMEEYGQPMHAYDYDTLAGGKIVVRRAKDGEKFMTLDGQERTLDSDMLMICDGEKAVGLAGIMGGENSKITDDVKTMLFEAATFDGTNIRKATKRLGLRTDASGKFEKGLDPENALAAMNRACQLIEELGAGEIVGGVVDVYPNKKERVRVPFEPERINALLGTNVSVEEMLGYFKMLELDYDEAKQELIIPTFRQDLLRTADIAEEVARFFGYANIPTTLPHGASTMGKISFKQRVEDVAGEIAQFCGFSQAMTYSFESPKVFDKLKLAADAEERKTVVISNPLGEDFSIMRTLPLNGMLNSLAINYNRRNKDVKLYELAKVYVPVEGEDLPDERVQFTLGFYGDGDFFTMKGVVEEFLEKIGMSARPEYDPEAGKTFLHPGRQAEILYKDTVIGYLGEVHPDVADTYGLGERTYIAVLDLPEILPFASFDRKYEGIAKFPAVTRDISMVMPKTVLVGEVEKIIEKRGGKLLEKYNLFDIYEGAQIKEGFKSVAYTISFRAKDRTLEDKDIQPIMEKILGDLSGMGIELRS